jgi:hypothetical protein
MSIDSIVFENGIFYCREFGNLTAEDAQLWADKAAEFAKEYAPKPIVALIDAREVKYESMEARHILAQASGIEGLELAAVVTSNPLTRQSSQIIRALAVKKHTYIFSTIEEAKAFLEENIPYIHAKAKGEE